MRQLHAAERGRLAGRVRVEAEKEDVREPPQLLELLLGERRTHRRDHRLDAGLPQGEHVRVPLDDDRAPVLGDRVAPGVQPVQERALAEELALGRVDVLRLQRVVVAQAACLEADDATACIGQREEQPPREVVAAAAPGEPGGRKLLLVEALRSRLWDEH